MGVLSFLRYSVESVVRNRLRSLFAIIGIVIALALIVGSWIAVDSSAYGLMRAAIDDILVDYQAEQRLDSSPNITQSFLDQRVDAIESVADVTKAAPTVRLYGWDFMNASGESFYGDYYYSPWGTLMFLERNDSTYLLEKHKVEGQMPSPGTVAVPDVVADRLRLDVGNNITLSYATSEWYFDNGTYVENRTYLNLSFEISQIWSQESLDGGGGYYPYYGSEAVYFAGVENPVVFGFDDYQGVWEQSYAFNEEMSPSISYHIWIDRDEVIRLSSIPKSLERLEFIRDRLAMKGYALGFEVYSSNLVYVLEDVYPRLEMIKVVATVLCLPVVALGTYLSVVGVDLGVNQRRREVGILKSRGASNRQVFSTLIVEALVLGTLAGLMGLLSGVLVSRLLLDMATTLAGESGARTSPFDFFVQPTTIVLAILFGVGLMLLSSYRPFKKISKTDVAEALHHYSPLIIHVDYKPRQDIIFLSLSILSIVSIQLGMDWAFENDWSWIVQLIVGILMLAGIVFFPLMPFLLSLSIVRLLTRGSRRLYAKFTWIVKPWTKELHHLVDRNIVRNPRRASNLCVIISLALAFGIFISVTMESSIAYEHDLVKYRVGADVRAEAYSLGYGGPEESPRDLGVLDRLAAVPGTDSATTYVWVTLMLHDYSWGWGSATSVLMDPASYRETVRPSSFYFVEGGKGSLEELERNGTVIMSEYRAKQMSLVVGDYVGAHYELARYDNGSYNYTRWELLLEVVGVVKGLPGLYYWYPEMYVNIDTVRFIPESSLAQGFSGMGAMYDVSEGVTQGSVADAAEDAITSSGLAVSQILTLDEELQALQDDPMFGALSDFLYAEYAFSVTIMTVGVGLLIFVAVTDREQELACIMARGSSGSQMRKILMGESITLMVIGLIIGIGVGLLTAYLFNTLWEVGASDVIQRRMLFSRVSWTIVGAAIAAMLVASLLATARAGRIKLAEVLRIRGG